MAIDTLYIAILSVVAALISAYMIKYLGKPEEMKKAKEEMKFYQDKAKEAKKAGDEAKFKEYTDAVLKASSKNFSVSMRSMIPSAIPFLVIFFWVLPVYFPQFIAQLPFALPLFTGHFPFELEFAFRDTIGYYWWYIIVTIPFSFGFRKIIDVA